MISVYADGSSSGNSIGPGGYGWVILIDGQPFKAGYGGCKQTTNNIEELKGAIKGLQALLNYPEVIQQHKYIELVSDSQYVLGIASGQYNPTKNLELCSKLKELAVVLGITTRWVKGHTGKDPWNTRVDSLARKGKLEHVPFKDKPLNRKEKKERKKKAIAQIEGINGPI